MYIMGMSREEAKKLLRDKGKVTVDEIGQMFDDVIMAKYGRQLDVTDPSDYQIILDEMTQELRWQLTQKYTGIDWYDADVRDAMEIVMREFPEIRTDPDKRMLFLLVSAIQSQNTAPADQLFLSMQAWKVYRENGLFPLQKESGKEWGLPEKRSSLASLNRMLIEFGNERSVVDFLLNEHSVGDLRALKRAHGFSSPESSIPGKADTKLPGAYFFGQKIGPFMANMAGVNDTTVDLWATRTVNRHSGRMLDDAGKIVDAPRNERERQAMKSIFKDLGSRFKVGGRTMTQQEAQAGMWFYEQNLFKHLGTTQRNPSLAAGARRYSETYGRAARAGGSGVERKPAGVRSSAVSVAPRATGARAGASIAPKL